MKPNQPSLTAINTIFVTIMLLLIFSNPLLGHGDNHHQPNPEPEPEPEPISVSDTNKINNVTQDITTFENQKILDDFKKSNSTPKGLGELIFILLIGTPLGLFFVQK